MKKRIEEAIVNCDLKNVEKYLDQYKKINPFDIDILSYEVNLALLRNDVERAHYFAKKHVRRAPQSKEAYYNLGVAEELKGNILMAYFYNYKAAILYDYDEEESVKVELQRKNNALMEEFDRYLGETYMSGKEAEYQMELLKAIEGMEDFFYGFNDSSYRDFKHSIGKYKYLTLFNKVYVGLYDNKIIRQLNLLNNDMDKLSDNKTLSAHGMSLDMDLVHNKGEFLNVTEGDCYIVKEECDNEEEAEYLLPIACENMNTWYVFDHAGVLTDINQLADKSFNYFRIKNNTYVKASGKCYFGRPIRLGVSSDKKKLVLNIFLDGLSGVIINGEGLKKHMPYTYGFFENGIICDNAYTCAEWTYPSIASYVSGLYTPGHMMFHNKLDVSLPDDIVTLDEAFHEAGYYTTRLSGDWRITPSYGYSRGIDRFVYQHGVVGYKDSEMICDAVDSLEAFGETNQYLWISLGDLHNIADCFELPLDVQTHIPLEYRNCGMSDSTSVKQQYSNIKIEQYYRYIKRIDNRLNYLYRYIEDNFDPDDIIVSLFSDHGQGYLIPEGRHFLSKERSKVTMMFRGGDAEKGIRTEELISTVDYPAIMCKLAGIEYDASGCDGNLPWIFGGDHRREYVISESIHPMDPYQAVIFSDNMSFEFVNPEPVQNDGRFRLGEYVCCLRDCEGNVLDSPNDMKKYFDILIEHIATLLIYD